MTSRTTRPLLGTALYALVLVVALLAPTSPPHARRGYLREFHVGVTRGVIGDLAINVAAFVPLGWGLYRSGRRLGLTAGPAMLTVAVAGAALSFAMETAQYFLPNRYSSVMDVAGNTAGAVLGGWWLARRRAT